MHGQILTENANVVNVLPPDSAALNTNGSVVNLEGYAACTFLLQKGDGAVGTTTITVEACDDTTPSNTTAITFKYRRMVAATNANAWGTLTSAAATGFATTAAADDMYEISVDPDVVGAATVNGTTGHSYVRLVLTQVDATACDHGAIAVLQRARYAGATPKDATA